MRLTGARLRTLEAICDAFAPGEGGLPSASERGVAEAIVEALGRQPREVQRRQFRAVLGLWNSRLLNLLSRGGFRRFSDLDLQARERVLLSWSDSRPLSANVT